MSREDKEYYVDFIKNEFLVFLVSIGITVALLSIQSEAIILKIFIGFFGLVDTLTAANIVINVVQFINEKIKSKRKSKEEKKEEVIEKEEVKEKNFENTKTMDYTISNTKVNEKPKVLVLKK